VLVRNDDVVLNVTSHGAEWKFCGLNGCSVWVRRIRYKASQKTNDTKIRLLAYAFQSWSRLTSTPISR
jgi:hypothetical protein